MATTQTPAPVAAGGSAQAITRVIVGSPRRPRRTCRCDGPRGFQSRRACGGSILGARFAPTWWSADAAPQPSSCDLVLLRQRAARGRAGADPQGLPVCRGAEAAGSPADDRDARGRSGSGTGRSRDPRGRRLGRRHPFWLVGHSLSPRFSEQVLRPACALSGHSRCARQAGCAARPSAPPSSAGSADAPTVATSGRRSRGYEHRRPQGGCRRWQRRRIGQ
jgi:hypothetical protein